MAAIDVIKYNGSPDVFAWKYPSEELGTWTQLIVNESQEAILFKGGKKCDVFTSGRHTLTTANIPMLNSLVNLPFGGRSPFTAEVWYVNKVNVLDVKWGTPTPIQLQDPKYGVFVPVRSFGQFGVKIAEAATFLTQLVGTLTTFDRESIVKYFRGLYTTKVKDTISSYLVHKKISILEINAYLDELSGFMKERIQPMLETFGITLVNFYVNDISIPEEDPAVQKLKSALAKRAEMNIVGYSYQQERSFDTLEGVAQNKGGAASDVMQVGVGLGMGLGMGGAVGKQFGQIAQVVTMQADAQPCPVCGTMCEKDKKFCGQCGSDIQATADKKAGGITCRICGTSVGPQAKFCPECGGVMQKKCSQCDALVRGDAKFCPECGEKVL